HAGAFGKAGGPAADGYHFKTSVLFQPFDLRANGVEVRNDGTGALMTLTLQRSSDGAAPRKLEGNADVLELLANFPDDHVGVTGRAWNFQQELEHPGEVLGIDIKLRHWGPGQEPRVPQPVS